MNYFHVWFSTKSRKWLLQGEIADLVKESMRRQADAKRIKLLECETMVDHVHLLVRADSPDELSGIMKLLKGRSAFDVFRTIPEVKLDGYTNALWQRGFGYRIVLDEQIAAVRRYIRTQDQRLEKYER